MVNNHIGEERAEETKFFFALTPEVVLDAVEQFGFRCTGRALALNSLENRVYEVEIENDKAVISSDRFKVIKFYRPGRWSREQIQAEHTFIRQLSEAEVPVVAPLANKVGETLFELQNIGIICALFPKCGGRLLDELDKDKALQVGRLVARLHAIGSGEKAPSRTVLNAQSFGKNNLECILQSEHLAAESRDAFRQIGERVCTLAAELLPSVPTQRVHGDLHGGNIIVNSSGPVLVDFDDMVTGPIMQDLWLLLPGRGDDARAMLDFLLEGYTQFRSFNQQHLALIEILRALRLLHFSAWINRRWHDPAFPKTFTYFGSMQYWRELMSDLNECLEHYYAGTWSRG